MTKIKQSQVRCFIERCDDGSIAPRPPGKCCPSLTMCSAPIKLVTDPFLDNVLDDAVRVSPEFPDPPISVSDHGDVTDPEFWRLEADVRATEIDDNGLEWTESTTEL